MLPPRRLRLLVVRLLLLSEGAQLLLQAVEDLEVSVDGTRCDEIADGSAEQMHKVSAALVAVGSIASNLAADVVPAVTTLVEMLAE